MNLKERVIEKPDAIIVIGAGLKRMNDEIACSAQSVQNVEKALDLLEELGTKDINLVFSGGFSLDSKTEAETMKKYFKEHYSEMYAYYFESNSVVYLETKSRNSYDNIRYSLNLAEQNKWRNIIFIDQPMHLLQLKLLATKELRKRNLRHSVIVEFIGAEPVWGGNAQKQWRNPFVFALYEILSTGYYLLKGKII